MSFDVSLLAWQSVCRSVRAVGLSCQEISMSGSLGHFFLGNTDILGVNS